MRMTTGAVLVLALLVGGCGGDGGEGGAEGMAMDSTMMPAGHDTMMPAGHDTMMAGMGGMRQGAAQEPDHEFLRMMSDHHLGLAAMGEDAANRAADASVKSAARKLTTKQAAQRDTMVAMIRRMYDERHDPAIMPQNRAQADSLRQTSGPEVDRYFLRTTIAHHEEGTRMIDRFMPRFTRPEVRQMAERMRAEQQREIQELRGKLQRL